MNEPKVFSELGLRDNVHWVDPDFKNGLASICKIEIDPDDNDRTLIEFHQITESVSFPDNESEYEDKDTGIKYTTNKKKYDEWMVPFIEEKIKEKERKIEFIKLEIEDLKKQIPDK